MIVFSARAAHIPSSMQPSTEAMFELYTSTYADYPAEVHTFWTARNYAVIFACIDADESIVPENLAAAHIDGDGNRFRTATLIDTSG